MKIDLYPEMVITQSRNTKELFLKQKAKVIWFTGLSGAGKTTLAGLLEKRLFEMDYLCHILDGDIIRSGINKDLKFTEEDRMENIRRIAEVSKLFLNSGIIILGAFISPSNAIREMAKNIIGENNFLEVYVNTPLEICEQRDPKNLYRKARSGEIKNFTGISSPFEVPEDPFIKLDNSRSNIEETIQELLIKIIPEIKY